MTNLDRAVELNHIDSEVLAMALLIREDSTYYQTRAHVAFPALWATVADLAKQARPDTKEGIREWYTAFSSQHGGLCER